MKLVDEINEQLEKVSEVKLLTPEENLRDRNWNRAPDGDWTHPAFRGHVIRIGTNHITHSKLGGKKEYVQNANVGTYLLRLHSHKGVKNSSGSFTYNK